MGNDCTYTQRWGRQGLLASVPAKPPRAKLHVLFSRYVRVPNVEPLGFLTMHKDELVVLREYADEMTARIAALSLEANGIPARVSADTAGGALPSLALVFPVRLIVRAADAELARRLLDTDAPPPPE